MNTTLHEKIDLLMHCFPNEYLFRGKYDKLTEQQTEALSYTIYLIQKGWGKTCATNRAGEKHNVSVRFLRRMFDQYYTF